MHRFGYSKIFPTLFFSSKKNNLKSKKYFFRRFSTKNIRFPMVHASKLTYFEDFSTIKKKRCYMNIYTWEPTAVKTSFQYLPIYSFFKMAVTFLKFNIFWFCFFLTTSTFPETFKNEVDLPKTHLWGSPTFLQNYKNHQNSEFWWFL